MATARFHSLKVRQVHSATRDAIAVTFDLPPELARDYDFVQGQYLTLRTTLDGQDLRRSYSICSAVQDHQLRVAIKRVNGGVFSNWAAEHLKPLVLELGGKDPLVVFADADLEGAAKCAVEYSLRNTGQVCCSIERVYVAEDIADAFEQRVIELARAWSFGDPCDNATKMGPLVSAEQRAKVAAQVEGAVRAGARLSLGGELPSGPGWFYPATVLTDVAQSNPITHAETFGPVVAITRFDGSEEEAVRLANDTIYGLGANVWTADAERAMRVARRIRAGQIGINRYLGGTSTTPCGH